MRLRSLVKGGVLVLGVAGAGLALANSAEPLSMQPALSYQARGARVAWLDQVPSRREQLRRLAEGTPSSPYDVLIVGGGATGTGCAVDAVTRWELVALSPSPPMRVRDMDSSRLFCWRMECSVL